MLKRKWSANILRHLANGAQNPGQITTLEPGLSTSVLNERLRTMHRYALISRFPHTSGSSEYRITLRGTKVLEILGVISAVEEQLDAPAFKLTGSNDRDARNLRIS